jgi:hypothetical protein
MHGTTKCSVCDVNLWGCSTLKRSSNINSDADAHSMQNLTLSLTSTIIGLSVSRACFGDECRCTNKPAVFSRNDLQTAAGVGHVKACLLV